MYNDLKILRYECLTRFEIICTVSDKELLPEYLDLTRQSSLL